MTARAVTREEMLALINDVIEDPAYYFRPNEDAPDGAELGWAISEMRETAKAIRELIGKHGPGEESQKVGPSDRLQVARKDTEESPGSLSPADEDALAVLDEMVNKIAVDPSEFQDEFRAMPRTALAHIQARLKQAALKKTGREADQPGPRPTLREVEEALKLITLGLNAAKYEIDIAWECAMPAINTESVEAALAVLRRAVGVEVEGE